MMDIEKTAWINRLRHGPLTNESQFELAAILERLWFPKRVGRRSQSEYSQFEINFYNDFANALRDDLDRRVEHLKKSNERPHGGPRTAAKAAMAERYGITVRALENRMKPLPNPRRKTG